MVNIVVVKNIIALEMSYSVPPFLRSSATVRITCAISRAICRRSFGLSDSAAAISSTESSRPWYGNAKSRAAGSAAGGLLRYIDATCCCRHSPAMFAIICSYICGSRACIAAGLDCAYATAPAARNHPQPRTFISSAFYFSTPVPTPSGSVRLRTNLSCGYFVIGMAIRLFLILLSCSYFMAAQTAIPEEGRWVFAPGGDDFSPEALLDLRSLNDQYAGEKGFIRVDWKGDFIYPDGSPVRFWAVNSTVGREKPWVARPRWRQTEPDLARHARFLAKRGVNMVRLHAFLNPATSAALMSDVNQNEVDWIWRAVAAFKQEGIYTTISVYWANNMRFSEAWGIDGGPQDAHGLLFIDEKLQEAYKNWLRLLLAPPNPYTGVPLAQDPAVAILQLQNEDSFLFWTFNNLLDNAHTAQRQKLGREFYQWVVSRYGSWEEASKAWGGNKVGEDDPGNAFLGFHNLWEFTQNRTGGFKRRLDDQLMFMVEKMRDFYARMTGFVKGDLGAGFLVNGSNWKTGDTARLEDLERYAYMNTDVAAVNRYHSGVHLGRNRTWAVMAGDEFTSPSILKNPLSFPLNLRQPQGWPFIITESLWVPPMAYSAEGPFLVAAYQSLTGIDGFYWFSTGDDEWSPPQSANGYLDSQMKWSFNNPDMLGTFPAAALMYRMGYLQRGEPAVVEERSLEDLYARRTPVIIESASYDPNRDKGDIAPESGVQSLVDPLAFLAGPVEVIFGGIPSRTRTADLATLIAPDRSEVRSTSGEIVFNTAQAWCTVNAPKAQGVAGFFDQRNEFTLSDVTLRSSNHYAAALVVSMDDTPIRDSAKILVQVGTQSRPTGWQEEEAQLTVNNQPVPGFRILNHGKAPWQVMKAAFEIEVRNPRLARGWVLDPNGMRRAELPLERVADGIRFRFPEDALYVVLEKE